MNARLLLVGVLLVVLGCGGGDGQRLRLSGTANYDGQPIPFGEVLFTPDGAKQNSGPQGIAHIRDGKYDTATNDGKGFAGGPTVLRVTGFTGPGGKLICEYEYRAELPRQDGTFNIEVPKQGKGKPGGGGPDI